MATVLRVDAPDHVRRSYAAVKDGGYTGLALFSIILLGGGLGGLVIQVVGHVPIGAAVCLLWTGGWSYVLGRAVRARREIARWRQPVRLGEVVIGLAHESYWKLSPETRVNYGLPLIRRMYELSLVNVRGDKAIYDVEEAMMNRWVALNHLVDAEDKLRLYAADPLLGDGDDLAAANEWRAAVDLAEREIRADDVL